MKIAFVGSSALQLATVAYADPLNCSLADYRAVPGLTATVADNVLTLSWDGERSEQVRMRLAPAAGRCGGGGGIGSGPGVFARGIPPPLAVNYFARGLSV